MILGVLSDSHGRHERTAEALRRLKARGATAFVHCGDVGGENVIAALAAGAVDETGQPRVWFVWGNTDYRDALLDRFVASVGLPLPPRNLPLRLTLAGRRIAVFHGHEREFETLIRRVADAARERESSLQRIGGGEEADGEGSLRWEPPEFVFHGHTHVTRDETIAGVRFINPGALHRAARFTAATVDLASGEVAWVTVPAAAST